VNKKPLISYLVALYNKRQFVIEAIESILAEQTSEFNLEICIVDDGSTDGGYEAIVERYGQKPEFKYDRFAENRGKNCAFNRAFELSSGDFVCLMGADDILVPGRTQILLKASSRAGKSVYGALIAVSADRSRRLYRRVPGSPSRIGNILANEFPGGAGMLTRKHAQDVFPIPVHLRFEDWWISFGLMRQDAIAVVQCDVLYYRIHGGNDSGCEKGGAELLRRQSERAIPALLSFAPYLRSSWERYHWKRSIAFRKLAVGERKIAHILFLYPDFFYIKTICLFLFGASMIYNVRDFLATIARRNPLTDE